jgi:hypothetical protein
MCATGARRREAKSPSQRKITAIKEKLKENNRRKAMPHPDDDEQLQDEERPGAPHNHAGGAWRYRARVDLVRGKIEAIAIKREVIWCMH